MKISLSVIIRTLAVINAFLPLCTTICNIFGYRFSILNYAVCAVSFAVISVAGVVYSFISKEKVSKKSDAALLALLPFLSLINWGLFLYESKSESVSVKVLGLICFICSAIIVIKYVKPLILKIASVTVSSLAILPLILLVALVFYPFEKVTVVETLPSPEGTYYAEITDCDFGTFGGDTRVHIYETKKLEFLVFGITKIPELVFIGEWKEYETMQIEWINEQYLVIDEILYSAE